jgi:hypothetical protein
MLQSGGFGRSRTTAKVLLTAREAFPELERQFIAAHSEIWASFSVFDLDTPLHSRAGLAIGRTWFDLVLHTLRRGVSINLTISDHDPVMYPLRHRRTWRSLRMFFAAAELAGPSARLDVRASMHRALGKLAQRMLLWPATHRRLARTARWLNAMPALERDAALREMPGLARLLGRGADGRLRPTLFPAPAIHPGSHHQKLAVFDRSALCIGGLDLDGRRHPGDPGPDDPRRSWHDVQLLMQGPVVGEAQAHLESFRAVVEGRREPGPQRRLLRTLSRRRRFDRGVLGPEPILQELRAAHLMLAARANRLIYLETRQFRDRRFARSLARLGRRNPQLSLLLILPATGADDRPCGGFEARFGDFQQTACMKILRRAFGRRLFVGGAAPPRNAGAPAAAPSGVPASGYVHARVTIFDDNAAIVSSADMTRPGLTWNTETGVYINTPRDVAELRRRVMSHWLPDSASTEFFDPLRAVEAWRALALENARHTSAADRQGFLLPYDIEDCRNASRLVPPALDRTA